MTKSTKIIAALGVVAGIGVAALPLTSYAAENDVTVTVNVSSAISQNITSTNTVTLAPNAADTSTMKINSSISTNDLDGYTITVKDKDTNTALVHTTTPAHTIPTGAGQPTAGTASWAVKAAAAYSGQTAGLNTTWTAMPASSASPLTLRNKSAGAAVTTNEVSTLEIGVATAAAQPTGAYADTIVFTANSN